jgi:hypothetical protein
LESCPCLGFSHGANRHAEILFPERLDDSIAAEHPVRFLVAFVDHRNLTTLGLQRATPAATGRPASDPADLLWKKRRPAHKTLADFRTPNLQPLRQICRECTALCKSRDLLAGPLVALDGSQGKAVHAKARHCTADKLKNLLQQIDQRVEASRKDLDGQDNEEDAGPPGGAVVEN